MEQEQRKQQNDQQRINRATREVQAQRAAGSARERPQGERIGGKAEQRARREVIAPRPAPARSEPDRIRIMRPEQRIQHATPPPVQRQPVERHAAPVAAPQRQPQQKVERKQERPPQNPQGPGGGKGKGKGKP